MQKCNAPERSLLRPPTWDSRPENAAGQTCMRPWHAGTRAPRRANFAAGLNIAASAAVSWEVHDARDFLKRQRLDAMKGPSDRKLALEMTGGIPEPRRSRRARWLDPALLPGREESAGKGGFLRDCAQVDGNRSPLELLSQKTNSSESTDIPVVSSLHSIARIRFHVANPSRFAPAPSSGAGRRSGA